MSQAPLTDHFESVWRSGDLVADACEAIAQDAVGEAVSTLAGSSKRTREAVIRAFAVMANCDAEDRQRVQEWLSRQ